VPPPSPPEHRHLAIYLVSRFAGAIGIQVQSVAIGWEVYSRTGNVLDLGWVGLAQFLPLALLSLYAGGVADRFDRKRILVTCRVLFAAGALLLALLSANPELGVAPVFLVLAMLGSIRAFANPAASALLPGLVRADHLPRAIAMSSTTFQIATIIGPATGGLVYAAAGARAAYVVSASCEIASALALLAITATLPKREAPPESGFALLVSGIRYVRENRVLLGAISLDLFAVLLGGAVALMPVFAKDILHVGETGLGLLRAAPAVGAAIVAFVFAVRPLTRHAGRVMLGGVAVFGLATIVFGLSKSFGLSLAALAVLGAADMMSVVVRSSLIQLRTPDAMRGRVASVNMVFIGASNELGELESGVAAAIFGTVRAVVLGGIGTLIVTALWAARFRELRTIDRLTPPT
jgi:MFS family permease